MQTCTVQVPKVDSAHLHAQPSVTSQTHDMLPVLLTQLKMPQLAYTHPTICCIRIDPTLPLCLVVATATIPAYTGPTSATKPTAVIAAAAAT